MFLRISLELPLKKLLIGGLPRIFEIGKVFRNEGIDSTHNPEFTMMEAYAENWDYHDMMDLMEKLFEKLTLELHGSTIIDYGDYKLDFSKPWKRLTMIEAVCMYCNFDTEPSKQELFDKLVEKVDAKELKNKTHGEMIAMAFEEFAEEHLIQPHHIIDHPIETTPLCKVHRDHKSDSYTLVERFESFIAGKEICNSYSELNDPVIQKQLLIEQQQKKNDGDKEAHPLDEDFIEALSNGMSPAGGLGIGIDRLVMLLTNQSSIKNVLFFPLVKN